MQDTVRRSELPPIPFLPLSRSRHRRTAVFDVAVDLGVIQRMQDSDVCLGHAVFAGTEGNACSVAKTERVSASVVASCLFESH